MSPPPIIPHIHCDLPDVGRDEQPLYPLEGRVKPGEMAGEHVVSVTEEVSIGQRRGG